MEKQRKMTLAAGIGIAGNVAGILVAVKRKSGFWGGVGWFIVGGLAGAALGYVVYSLIPETGAATTPPPENLNTTVAREQTAFQNAFLNVKI